MGPGSVYPRGPTMSGRSTVAVLDLTVRGWLR